MMEGRFEHFSLSIFNISRYWNLIATEEMKKYGLKGAYALYIEVLNSYPEKLTAAKLCELCERDKADVSRAMKTMQEKGLIEKVGDNYRAGLVLTKAGKKLADSLNKRVAIALDIAGKGVSEEDREIMYHALDVITQNLRDISKKGLPE